MKCYMKYAVNEAGVSALQNISTALMNSVADLLEKTSQLQTITSDNEDSLGPHKASLNQAIMEIYIGLKESTESISTLAASAKDIAEAYQEIIDNDYLSSTAESSAGTAAGTGGIGSTHAAGVVAPADRIKTCGREWTESLSKENKAAIHSYTGTAYSNINARLRGLEKSFDPGNQECAIRIHQALSGASIPADCTVYRGVSSKALGMLRMLPDNMLVGKTFTDHGFMSTSLERNSAFGGDMLLEVDVPKGAHGAYVGDISSAGHYESEVLFDAGQQMRITGVRCDENGRRIVSVRIMT